MDTGSSNVSFEGRRHCLMRWNRLLDKDVDRFPPDTKASITLLAASLIMVANRDEIGVFRSGPHIRFPPDARMRLDMKMRLSVAFWKGSIETAAREYEIKVPGMSDSIPERTACWL